MVNAAPKRQRNALIAAWFSVGNGILLVAGFALFARALASRVADVMGARAWSPADQLSSAFWRQILYLAAPFLLGAIVLLFVSAARYRAQATRISNTIAVGVWFGFVAVMFLPSFAFYVWLLVMAVYLPWGPPVARGRTIQIAALGAGIVILSVGYRFHKSWQHLRNVEATVRRDVLETGAVFEEVRSLGKGEVAQYVRQHDSEAARDLMLKQFAMRLRQPVRDDWTEEDRRALSDLADAGLQSDEDFVRELAAEVKSALLFMGAVPGRYSSAIADCPTEHCRERLGEMFFDEINPGYPQDVWTSADVAAAMGAVRSVHYSHKKSAARLLSLGLHPGDVCDALTACTISECDGATFFDGLVDRLKSEPEASWTDEDVACIEDFMNRPRYVHTSAKRNVESALRRLPDAESRGELEEQATEVP
jgi:hypothetical protein